MFKRLAFLIVGEKDTQKTRLVEKDLPGALNADETGVFEENGRRGFIKKTTLQKDGDGVDRLDSLKDFDFAIIPARSEAEQEEPKLHDIKLKLVQLGYSVFVRRTPASAGDTEGVLKGVCSDIVEEIRLMAQKD